MGTSGMRWGDLSDSQNGMRGVLIIMFVEWLLLLPVALYLDQILGGIRRDPLFFIHYFRKKPAGLQKRPSLQRQGSKVFVEMDRPDVAQEVSCNTSQNRQLTISRKLFLVNLVLLLCPNQISSFA